MREIKFRAWFRNWHEMFSLNQNHVEWENEHCSGMEVCRKCTAVRGVSESTADELADAKDTAQIWFNRYSAARKAAGLEPHEHKISEVIADLKDKLAETEKEIVYLKNRENKDLLG